MQHNRAGRKLRRSTPHRLAMFSNQLTSLMTHERIQTTLSKAKELRPLAEKLITTAKTDGVEARSREVPAAHASHNGLPQASSPHEKNSWLASTRRPDRSRSCALLNAVTHA